MAGRRRDPALDAAIRAAGAELLHERGWSGFTVEAVAARVGVPKSTVYKRWSSRVHLASALLDEWLVGAVDEVRSTLQAPVEQRLRLLVELQQRFTSVPEGRAVAEVLVSDSADPAVRQLRLRAVTYRATCHEVVRSMAASRDMTGAIDPELVADMLLGAAWLRSLRGFRGDDESDMLIKTVSGLLRVDAGV